MKALTLENCLTIGNKIQLLEHSSEKLYLYPIADDLVQLSISNSILCKIIIHISSLAIRAPLMHEDRVKDNNEGCMKPIKGVDGEKEGAEEERAL